MTQSQFDWTLTQLDLIQVYLDFDFQYNLTIDLTMPRGTIVPYHIINSTRLHSCGVGLDSYMMPNIWCKLKRKRTR